MCILGTACEPAAPATPVPVRIVHGNLSRFVRAPVAQRIEQVPSKHLVAGSSPAGRTLPHLDTRGDHREPEHRQGDVDGSQ
jgi:hypothetical protein